ncbi:unnamed protein product, partial [Mycena citricolor]
LATAPFASHPYFAPVPEQSGSRREVMSTPSLLHSCSSTYASADPDTQLEADIADEQHHDTTYDENDLPPRPNSRLGFNGETSKDTATEEQPHSRPRSGSFQWTKGIFKRIGILSGGPCEAEVDMDITALSAPTSPEEQMYREGEYDDDDIDPLTLPALPSLTSVSPTSSLVEMDVYSTEYDVESDDSLDQIEYELEILAEASSALSDVTIEQCAPALSLAPSLPPLEPLPPITIPDCEPSAFTPQPPAPLRRSEFSCLPSPLSPNEDERSIQMRPLRHAYGHHGRSRHSLLHLKYLWSLREDQWARHLTRLCDRGISVLDPRARVPPRSVRLPTLMVPSVPPMTIHPRRGELSALRDPYCAHMDRCFVNLPAWTMAKTLWMYDVHVLASHQRRLSSPFETADDSDDSEGESMAESMSSAGFSDDSDHTLVDGEDSIGSLVEIDLDGDKIPMSSTPPSSSAMLAQQGKPHEQPRPRWETSWYKRWEVLIELMRLDATKGGQVPPPCRPVRSPHFFIEDDDENDDTWDEENWDEMLRDVTSPAELSL